MLHGLVNRFLGTFLLLLRPGLDLILDLACRSTHSGTVFSPYDVKPFKVPQIDIYDLIRYEEQQQTRHLDQDGACLQPILSDEDYDPDTELVPCEPIDLNLDLPPPQPVIPAPIRPPAKKRATCAISKTAARHPPPRVLVTPFLPAGNIIRMRRPPSARQIKKNWYHTALCKEHQAQQQLLTGNLTKHIVLCRIQESTLIFTAVDVSDLHTTSMTWLGGAHPQARPPCIYRSRTACHGHDIPRLGCACHPLMDSKNHVFACLAGRPRHNPASGVPYKLAIVAATELFEECGAQATGNGRRGTFVAVTAGVSYGGGKSVLLNTRLNATICTTMVAHWAVQRIEFSARLPPALHQFYAEQTLLLHLAVPHLHRLFLQALSVFSACTFNFGPSTVTFPHVDTANLAWGWCLITTLGKFDPDCGGHLILWDLGLVIRFPPGSTLMIPSALLHHSNVAIQQGETRYSLTQFTAGSLFRWVHNGNSSDTAFFATAKAKDLEVREAERAQRWENGIRMFQVWDADTKTFSHEPVHPM
ncbi:hypothetical protein C8R43DRAFT_1132972 [Mycena crocata]|nr:hypothetical protein C8R43DRAFT_1132972 [Mycena crocata]